MTGSVGGSPASGSISGSMSGSVNGEFNGFLRGSITGSVSTLLSGSIKFPFNLMGQTNIPIIGINPESIRVFLTASSNKIGLEATRLSKYNISTQNGTFTVNAGVPLQLTTTDPLNSITFTTPVSFSDDSGGVGIINY
jgi:hypothetical protein